MCECVCVWGGLVLVMSEEVQYSWGSILRKYAEEVY